MKYLDPFARSRDSAVPLSCRLFCHALCLPGVCWSPELGLPPGSPFNEQSRLAWPLPVIPIAGHRPVTLHGYVLSQPPRGLCTGDVQSPDVTVVILSHCTCPVLSQPMEIRSQISIASEMRDKDLSERRDYSEVHDLAAFVTPV